MGKTLAIAFLLAGCGQAPTMHDPRFITGFDPPALAAGEVAVLGPAIRDIEPGSDVTLCSYLDEKFEVETDVPSFRVYQSTGGHHATLYAARMPKPAGTHVCNEDDMVNARLIAPGGADKAAATSFSGFPDGLAFRIPAGSQLLAQTHWINATGKAMDGQAVFYLKAVPSSANTMPADLFTAVSTQISVPPGQTATVVTACTFKETLNFFMLNGHAHHWATHLDVQVIDAQGAATQIYKYDWQPEFEFNPPLNVYSKEQPLVIAAGQQLKTTCVYDNTTTSDIVFPKEMCVGDGFYFPGRGEIDCVDGIWPN